MVFRTKQTLSDNAACRGYSAQAPVLQKDRRLLRGCRLSHLFYPHLRDSQRIFPESIGLFCSSTPLFASVSLRILWSPPKAHETGAAGPKRNSSNQSEAAAKQAIAIVA